MVKSNNMGTLSGTVYNINDRGNLVSFTLGVREYDSKEKKTVMVFYPMIAVYDNLKKLLGSISKGTPMSVAYSLFMGKNGDSKYPQVGIRVEDVTLMAPKSANNDAGNSGYSKPKQQPNKKVQEEDDAADMDINDLDDDLLQYFKS